MSYANEVPTGVLTSDSTSIDDELVAALRVGVMRLARRLRLERSGSDLTLTQLSALGSLFRYGNLTIGELAAIEKVKPPSMTRTINFLQDAGLVTRAAHESDGRQVVVGLTDAGPRRARRRPTSSRRLARHPPRRFGSRRTRPVARRCTPARPHGQRAVKTTFAALRIRNYRLFATGSLISNTGTWMQRVAQDWLVLALTGSAGALGLTTGLQFLPILLFSPIAGVLADRFPKRSVMMLTQIAMAVTAAVLGILAITGVAQAWHVYVIAFAFGTAVAVRHTGPPGVRQRDGRSRKHSPTPSPSTRRRSTSAG